MEHTTLPRVPGRDYAGTVIRGPADWIGAEVWGTGGEIGYTIDGSHADLIAVPVASLRRKPRTLSLQQAASVGLTYLAAWLGLIEYAQIRAGETLLVVGAAGGVGGAAAQIGKWRGARVIGVDRHALRTDAPAAPALDEFLLLETKPLDPIVRAATEGRGAEVVFDTVGGDVRASAQKPGQRPTTGTASTGDRRVSFDLIDFYREAGCSESISPAMPLRRPASSTRAFFEQGKFRAPQIDRVRIMALLPTRWPAGRSKTARAGSLRSARCRPSGCGRIGVAFSCMGALGVRRHFGDRVPGLGADAGPSRARPRAKSCPTAPRTGRSGRSGLQLSQRPDESH